MRTKPIQLMLGFATERRYEIEERVRGKLWVDLIYLLRTKIQIKLRPLLSETRMAMRMNFKSKP